MVVSTRSLKWVMVVAALGGSLGCKTTEAPRPDPGQPTQQGEDRQRCEDPAANRSYVSRDPEVCKRVRFACPLPTDLSTPPRTNYFGDACGCGCTSNAQ